MAPFNAANRKDIREAEKQAKLAEQQQREVVANLMDTIGGRSWILNLLERCHIFSTSFSRDALQMACAEGERNIGLLVLMDIMMYCPDQYIVMMKERNERDAARDTARDTRRTTDSGTATEFSGSTDSGGDAEGPSDSGEGEFDNIYADAGG